ESVAADPAAFARALLGALGGSITEASWAALWTDANAAARSALREAAEAIPEPFEGRAVYDLADVLPDGATLVPGNSMPVRDIDSFFASTARLVRIVGTRGASGIDGVVSTAVGASASGQGPVALDRKGVV